MPGGGTWIAGPRAVSRGRRGRPSRCNTTRVLRVHRWHETPPTRTRAQVSHPDRGRCLHVDATTPPGGDMASSTRVPATEITGIYGSLVKTMSRRMLGQVPEAT